MATRPGEGVAAPRPSTPAKPKAQIAAVSQKQVEEAMMISRLATQFDHKMNRRDNLLLLNSVMSVMFMLLLYSTNWQCEDMEEPDTRCSASEHGIGDSGILPYHCFKSCEVVSTSSSQACKFMIFLLTITLAFQLREYWIFASEVEAKGWKDAGLKWKTNMRCQSSFKWELLCLWWHTPPFLDAKIVPGWMYGEADAGFRPLVNDKVCLLVWLRLYTVLRVIRNRSLIHKERETVARGCIRGSYPVPIFDTSVALKSLFYLHGAKSLLICVFVLSLVMTHMCYVLEREYGYPIGWTYGGSMWFVMETLTTLGFGDFIPSSTSGRVAAVITCVIGMLATSFVIAVVNNICTPASHQLNAIEVVVLQKLQDKVHVAANQWTQIMWRKKLERRRRTMTGLTVNEKRKRVIAFTHNLMRATAQLRRANESKVLMLTASVGDQAPDPVVAKVKSAIKTLERNNNQRHIDACNFVGKLERKMKRLEDSILGHKSFLEGKPKKQLKESMRKSAKQSVDFNAISNAMKSSSPQKAGRESRRGNATPQKQRASKKQG